MSLARFRQRAVELGVEVEPRVMDHTTHTAQDAAAAVGCAVGAIVKSLLFVADSEPLLVLVSGLNRVDTALLSRGLGAEVTMADAKTVKAVTGYSIGGVPPFGHTSRLRTLLDSELLEHEEVWAAAGAASAVFPITPHRLAEITGAEIVPVA